MLAPTGNPPLPTARVVVTSSGGVPPALAALPAGALIVGAVLGQDRTGRVLVRTDAGTLALASHLDLRRGNTVTLRVRGDPVAGGPAFAATVELVDGRPPQPAHRPTDDEPIAPARPVLTSSGAVPPALAALPAGASIVGAVTGHDPAGRVLVRTEAGTLALAGALAGDLDLRRGNTVTLRVHGNPGRGGPVFAATVEAVDGKPPRSARPVVTSSGAVPPALATLPAGTPIVGTVTGHGPAGDVVVRTEAGTLTLATQVDLRRGNTVTLRVHGYAGRGGPAFAATVEAVDGKPPQAARPDAGRQTGPGGAPTGNPPSSPTHTVVTSSGAVPPAPATLAAATPIVGAVTGHDPAGGVLVRGGPARGGPAFFATVEAIDARPPQAAALRAAGGETSPAPPAGAAIVGAVTGHDAEGRVLVRTEAGTLALASDLQLRPGDTVTLRVTGGPLFAATVEAVDGRPPQPDRPPAGREPGAVPAPVVVTAPGEVSPALAALPAGAPIVGVVVGHDPAGHVLVGTDSGTLALATQLDLKQGSTVTLRVREATVFAAAVEAVDGQPPEAALAAPPPLPPAPELRPQAPLDLARSWPALGVAIETLRHVDPKLAQATVDRAIPQAGANLAQVALTFIAALRAGDLAGWLGRAAVGALEDGGHGALVRRLTGDLGQIAGLVDRSAPGEWQPFLVPLLDGAWLRQLRLFVRRRRGDADDENGELRFVVEIELRRFGELQLDGFLRERRLDLIVRSQAPLADAERRDVTAIFSQGLALGALTGALSFQVTQEFPVAPLEALAAGDASGAHGGVVA